MATLNVCSRLASKIDRFQISITGLEETVKTLAYEISKHKSLKETDFDILYSGQVLNLNSTLSNYALQHMSTVYIVPKFTSTSEGEESQGQGAGSPNKSEVTRVIQSALLNLEFRNIVERMLNDPDAVEHIISVTPGLDKDPSVLAMLQEPELLAVLAHPNNMDSLLQLHPSFAYAAVTIAAAVKEEGAKMGSKSGAGAMSYSMDQMSDDDDDMPQPNRSGGQSITASQLAAALQAATGSAMMGGAHLPVGGGPSTSQGGPSQSSSGTITSDFFQQAMVHAQTASSDSALQQLREMGITDENVARQALAATGGDIQAALDLIFEDGLM